MTALTAARDTPERLGQDLSDPVKAGAIIFQGSILCLDAAGYAVAGATAVGLVARGRAKKTIDNRTGADGAAIAEARAGLFRFGNSAAADAITRAEIGDNAFIVDDQTLARTNAGGTRSVAGEIVDVDALGVWVRLGQ